MGCACSSFPATIPPVGHPRAPSTPFRPNFRVETSIELPSHVNSLDVARERLFGNVEAVILLSPIAGSFGMLPAPASPAVRFTFAERVPVECCHQTVRLDACQRELLSPDSPDQGGARSLELIYESLASPAGVYVRKRRRLTLIGGRVHVDELIEGRCSPVLRCIVQKEATAAHRAHMSLYSSLFHDDDGVGEAGAVG